MTYRGAISSLKVENGVLFVPHIADSLKEKQREALCLPISPIYSGAAQRIGCVPHPRLELAAGYFAHVLNKGSLDVTIRFR